MVYCCAAYEIMMRRMRMSRITAAVVSLCILAACSSDSSSSDTTSAPTDTVSSVDTTTDTEATSDVASTWEVVPSATMQSTTQDVPEQEGLESNVPPDGQYWGSLQVLHGTNTPTAVAELVKLYSGDECYAYAEMTNQAPEDMCTNDFGAVDYPRAIAALDDSAYVTVITENAEYWPTKSYVISSADLQKLVVKESVTGKPTAYNYVPYPFMFTITDGIVTRAEQVWIP